MPRPLADLRVPIPPERVGGRFRRADLVVERIINPPDDGFFVRVYFDTPDADETTPEQGHAGLVGVGAVLARPHHPESVARGRVPWADPAHPEIEPDPPVTLRFAVGDRIDPGATELRVTLVVVDRTGRRLPDATLRFDGLSLRFAD
jgi:hypothetical protein